jgi:hypothetical protein
LSPKMEGNFGCAKRFPEDIRKMIMNVVKNE